MNHFTDRDGYNGIVAQPTWVFKASQPPGDHPVGAYFTTLGPETPKLSKKLGIPRRKLQYLFTFEDVGDLTRLPGGRGEFIFYSPTDYEVAADRQQYAGEA